MVILVLSQHGKLWDKSRDYGKKKKIVKKCLKIRIWNTLEKKSWNLILMKSVAASVMQCEISKRLQKRSNKFGSSL